MGSTWLICLQPRRTYRQAAPRWLTQRGTFSCNRQQALSLSSPEIAAQRLQAFAVVRGWSLKNVERLRLIAASGSLISTP
mgnify:CR=1 FL=1